MCSADAPDNSGINAAALASAELSKEALAWYKEKDAQDRPMRDKLANVAYDVAEQQLASSKSNDALAADYADYNKTTFRPLEKSIVAEAESYDTPEKRQAAVDAGLADTNRAFAQTNDATARAMAANGINPGSTRAMSVMQGQGVDQAIANAGSAFNARKGIETVGRAMKMDAASLGRGLASSQATSAQVALTAGNNAVSNTGTPLSASQSATGLVGQGFNTAIQGQQVAGNLYGQAAQNTANANSSSGSALGALGGIAGQFAGSSAGSAALVAMSDVNMKTDIEGVSDEEALEATNATPVSKWKYDPAKLASAGIPMPPGAEGENIGPMAQDVNATMGEKAAPGGKKLNLVTMNGLAMKSIQALDKKVNRLAKIIEKGVSA